MSASRKLQRRRRQGSAVQAAAKRVYLALEGLETLKAKGHLRELQPLLVDTQASVQSVTVAHEQLLARIQRAVGDLIVMTQHDDPLHSWAKEALSEVGPLVVLHPPCLTETIEQP
jgi:hypothetical protein